MKSESKVAVLLCTYNGSKFIRKQLDSIVNQIHLNWVIYASDDGSTDETLDILKEYQTRLGEDRIFILEGPRRGFAWNFISLLNVVHDDTVYYAFSDQDDVWLDDKLQRAVLMLDALDHEIPALYCGRTMLVDEHDQCIGYSPLFSKKPSFRNALIQSIAGGNTMMMNNVAKDLIIKTPRWEEIVSHDWWIYIVITGCGGNVIYDPNPTIKYRQHSDNLIGSNISLLARMKRIRGVLDGKFQLWIQKNISLLALTDIKLTSDNVMLIKQFNDARCAGLIKRVCLFRKMKMYRQTYFGSVAFALAILFKKV